MYTIRMVFAAKIIVMEWAKDGIFMNTDFSPQTKTCVETVITHKIIYSTCWK